jgi:hypothetical protein
VRALLALMVRDIYWMSCTWTLHSFHNDVLLHYLGLGEVGFGGFGL